MHPPTTPRNLWSITVTDEAPQKNETSTLPINMTCSITTLQADLIFTKTINLHLEKCTAPRPQDDHVHHFVQKRVIKKVCPYDFRRVTATIFENFQGHRLKNMLFFDDGDQDLHHNYEAFIVNPDISDFLQPNCSYHLDPRSGRNKTVIHCCKSLISKKFYVYS